MPRWVSDRQRGAISRATGQAGADRQRFQSRVFDFVVALFDEDQDFHGRIPLARGLDLEDFGFFAEGLDDLVDHDLGRSCQTCA